MAIFCSFDCFFECDFYECPYSPSEDVDVWELALENDNTIIFDADKQYMEMQLDRSNAPVFIVFETPLIISLITGEGDVERNV